MIRDSQPGTGTAQTDTAQTGAAPTDTAQTTAVGTGSLRRRRRALLLWSALPVLLALCVSAKLLSLGIFGGQAAHGFEAQDQAAVASASAGLRAGNFVEPHKAPFAEGDSRVLSGDFAAARQLFEEALTLAEPAGPEASCVIRVNLVLSIERLGDERVKAEDPTAAARLFAEGLAVIDEAPDGCFAATAPNPSTAPDPSTAQDTGEKLEQAEARIRQKAADAKAGEASTPQPGEQTTEPQAGPGPVSQSQLDQLKDSARESQRERNDGQERGEYLGDSDYGPGPDRPW
jgi:hypothetical protein